MLDTPQRTRIADLVNQPFAMSAQAAAAAIVSVLQEGGADAGLGLPLASLSAGAQKRMQGSGDAVRKLLVENVGRYRLAPVDTGASKSFAARLADAEVVTRGRWPIRAACRRLPRSPAPHGLRRPFHRRSE